MKNIGSTWHRWDLHFHTQTSYDYGDKSVTDDDIINVMHQNGISAFAITDHHVIDIDRLKSLQEKGNKAGICVLPGIEFLADARGDEPIHFIGIFSELCNINHVWEQIKNKTALNEYTGTGITPTLYTAT